MHAVLAECSVTLWCTPLAGLTGYLSLESLVFQSALSGIAIKYFIFSTTKLWTMNATELRCSTHGTQTPEHAYRCIYITYISLYRVDVCRKRTEKSKGYIYLCNLHPLISPSIIIEQNHRKLIELH